ncbi:MAG: FtsX-like permease family protein [Dehalococcoidia bacterium]
MDELFGISMNLIMVVLLAVLAVALGTVVYVAARNRIMFFMGLRNMPRRMAQTVLIIIGLMLSTLIISAAFSTGDTVDHSLTSQAYTLLGHTDEWVERLGEGQDAPGQIESTIDRDTVDRLRQAIDENGVEIDGFLPMLLEQVPAVNPRTRQSEPAINIVGVDSASLEGFPDVVSTKTGDALDVASLNADELYMNRSAADALDARAGDTVQLFVSGQPHEMRVVDIVKNSLMTGVGDFDAKEGMVTRLDTLQELVDRPGEVNLVAISNPGGVRDGLDHSAQTVDDLDRTYAAAGLSGTLETYNVKRDLVDGFEEAGNFMTTFFLIFGLFSIAAGMLLIVMIFVMLAAERKSELGMARAVGTKRGHLIQMFLAEGMAYNILSAAVGAGLGVLVSFGIATVMGRIFSDFFNITPYVTLRSIVISYSLGVSLTFLTVTFSSWRVSNLNIVAAIRDLSDNAKADPEFGTWRGYLRGVLNAVVAVFTFPIGPFVQMLNGHPFGFPSRERVDPDRIPLWPFIVLPFAPFYLVALAIVYVARDRKPDTLPMWLLVAGSVIPPVGLVLVALQHRKRPVSWSTGVATLGILFGALLIWFGLSADLAFPFALGSTLAAFGIAVVLGFFGASQRLVYTSAGIFLLVFWGLTAGNRLEPLFGKLNGDVEMFFLSGVAMVTASTFVLVYNSDVFLGAVTRLSGVLGGSLPAVRTAVAYPLANKFRTGMTLAMISLVVFALTMMSTMNLNFNRLFLADEARGGWDVVIDENPNNPIDDLSQALRDGGSTLPDEFRAVGHADFAGESRVIQQSDGATVDTEGTKYPVVGVDAGFLEGGRVPLSARSVELKDLDDQAIWQMLETRNDVALVDGFTVGGGGFNFDGDTLTISGIKPDKSTFEPVMLHIVDPISHNETDVEVIGVISFGASASFPGVYVSQATFQNVFGTPIFSRDFVGLQDPGDAQAAAREIEATLLPLGAQAESIKKQIDDSQALTRNFFLLMQGFMGLGLFVGLAAVGVIAFRTVVERRQQIGMLRAIGYKRSTVALSFMLESAFIMFLGIGSGVGLAIWLSFFLITSNEFPTTSAGYAIPWPQIIFISGLTFLASLVMTFIPARQAAGVPTAEALRYE